MATSKKPPESAAQPPEGETPPRDAATPGRDTMPMRDPRAGASPATTSGNAATPATAPSTSAEVSEFLARMKAMTPRTAAGRGRLVFAMDATMSRQPTWDMALALQSDMFDAVKDVGGLDVQLVYFRGNGECRASKWVSDPAALARLMTTVSCQGGYTQIGKVLGHTRGECETRKLNALVYVGDCMEEDVDELCQRAGALALLGVPVFLFQEGRDGRAEVAFKEIARLTRGAWCPFGAGSAAELRALLSAVAVYAAGGRKALEALSHDVRGSAPGRAGARRLLEQMKPGGR